MKRYDEEYEEVTGTDISPLASGLSVVGLYLARVGLTLALVAFILCGLFLASAGDAP